MDINFNLLNLIPTAAITFVGILIICKIYISIRSKFSIKVNCWFCNINSKIPYKQYNKWNCLYCGQYNGFNKDGDYNKEISQHYENNTINYCKTINTKNKQQYILNETPKNGLCNTCNENQRIKIEKISQFEPDSEDTFDYELKIYRDNLENLYRLCVQCEKHVEKTLREKKKMILGAKLNYFMKNSKNYKRKSIKYQKNIKKSIIFIPLLKNINCGFLIIFALINFYTSLNEFNELNCKNLDSMNFIWYITTIFVSHIITIIKIFNIYIEQLLQIHIIYKIFLYIKTISILMFYTAGLRFQKFINFLSYFINGIPFLCILLAFFNNILNGFKINKYTLLLTIWSIYAVISSSVSKIIIIGDIPLAISKVILSTLILILSIPRRKNTTKYLLSQNNNSFHRIYSENYMITNDLDTSNFSKSSNSNESKNISNLSFDQRSIKSFANSLNSTIKSTSSSFPDINLSPTSAFKTYSKHNQNTFNNFNINNNLPFSSSSSASILSLPLNTNNHKIHDKFPNSISNFDKLSVFSSPSSPRSRQLNLFQQSSQEQQPSLLNFSINSDYKSCCNKSIFSSNNNNSSLLSKFHTNNVPNPSSSSSSSFIVQHVNLLSPSNLTDNGKSEYTLAPSQLSWISGGYFNRSNDINQFSTIKKRNIFNITDSTNIVNKDNWSRGSSQSSGFESQTSSITALNCIENKNNNFNTNNNVSRENSYLENSSPPGLIGIGGVGNNLNDDRCAISPFPSSVSELNYPISSSPSFNHNSKIIFNNNIPQKSFLWDSLSKNQQNFNTANNYNKSTFKDSPFLSFSKRNIESEKELTNVYLEQTKITENNSNKIDPFDLNIMNKNLSSIEDDTNWKKDGQQSSKILEN